MKNTKIRNVLVVLTLASAVFFYAFKPTPKVSNYLLSGLIALILLALINDVIAKIKDRNHAKSQVIKQNTLSIQYQIVSNIIGIAVMIAALFFFLSRI
ncbi:MAG: hypothetical protein V4538_08765 [Bacteroidota bacterium]